MKRNRAVPELKLEPAVDPKRETAKDAKIAKGLTDRAFRRGTRCSAISIYRELRF